MSEVQTCSQITEKSAWDRHADLVRERVRKTMARERLLKRDFREVDHFTEVTEFQRWGTSQRFVQCAQAEATHVVFTRREWFE
jgi:hypothetical protein